MIMHCNKSRSNLYIFYFYFLYFLTIPQETLPSLLLLQSEGNYCLVSYRHQGNFH